MHVNKNRGFVHCQKEFLNISFCVSDLAINVYLVNEILPKRKCQNIVQCPFNCPFGGYVANVIATF